MTGAEGTPRIAVIVLAAGDSTRLGRPKQLVAWRGTTLLRHATIVALEARLGPVLVVLGAEAERLTPELGELDVQVVPNARWREGLGTSVAAGVAAAASLAPPVGAVLLTTCDQPRVGPALLRALAAAHAGGAEVAAAAAGEVLGVPALFGRTLLGELRSLTGERGAAGIIARHRDTVAAVPAPEAAVDVDAPADLGLLDT